MERERERWLKETSMSSKPCQSGRAAAAARAAMAGLVWEEVQGGDQAFSPLEIGSAERRPGMQKRHVATHCGGQGHRDYRGERPSAMTNLTKAHRQCPSGYLL